MPLLFAVTLFLSAGLLFMVQPMVGKMILPLLGGSPAVWNACMVFFQALLLLGYLYAHFVSTRLPPKRQWVVHFLVLLAPVAAMGLAVAAGHKHTPIAVADALAPADGGSPILGVMALLSVAIGVPFFVSATSAPLLQKWFGFTGHPSARDPYFLYAASNAGSLLSLLGYPLLVEPNMILAGQAWLWAAGFVALIVLILACGRAAANPVGVPPEGENLPRPGRPAAAAPLTEPPPSALRVIRWVALAFVPSSFMLAVTFYMTTDIASVPLLWALPLALYLVTFIIAFSTVVPSWFRLLVGNLAPVMVLLLVFVIVSGEPVAYISPSVFVKLALNVGTFFAVALMCHYELAIDRPAPAHLTGYFLWISVGGVLGGIFNALVAPVVFAGPTEYQVTLVVACLLIPRLTAPDPGAAPESATGRGVLGLGREFVRGLHFTTRTTLVLDFAIPVMLGLVFAVLSIFLPESPPFGRGVVSATKWVNLQFGTRISADTVLAVLVFALPVMACFFFVDRPLRFALCVAALLTVQAVRNQDESLLYTERTFFGILKVEDRGSRGRSLVHGTTLHGTQFTGPRLHPLDAVMALGSLTPWDPVLIEGSLGAYDPTQEPLTYYHRTGPVGAMFHELRTRNGGADAKADVAMVGLGTGSAAAYALPGQRLTFYEIDPAVRRIVEEPKMVMNPELVARGAAPEYGPFTYVHDARKRGATVDFRMGDARLKLKDEDRRYALLMVDAFSSDAIPVHLLTKEAVEMYLDKLAPNGILALHVSNKYIRLEPVCARIAAELGLTARVWNDDSESRPGKTASSWVVLARDPAALGTLAAPAAEQVKEYGTKNFALADLLRRFPPETNAAEAMARAYGPAYAKYKDVLDRQTAASQAIAKLKESSPEDRAKLDAIDKDRVEAKRAVQTGFGPQAFDLVNQVHQLDPAKTTLADLTEYVAGPMFHPLKLSDKMPLWTDDYSDVMSVMMLKEIQWVRRQLGLPTLGSGE